MNEGFASLLESVIVDKVINPISIKLSALLLTFEYQQLHPKWRMMDQFVVDVLQIVMLKDANPNVNAMTKPINTVDEISNIYDFVVYPKAASVIKMMEHCMGAEVFQKSLKMYLNEK